MRTAAPIESSPLSGPFRWTLVVLSVLCLLPLAPASATAQESAPSPRVVPLAPGDADDDGIPDDIDNCPQVSNPDQLDMDHDGYGDVCDACPVDRFNDRDGDGICSPPDNCEYIFNPGQEDRNGDGIGDRCDTADGYLMVEVPDGTHLEWQRESGCDGFNVHRGDLYVLRSSGVYTQDPSGPLTLQSCNRYVSPMLDSGPLPVGSAAFYLVACTQGGVDLGLGENSEGQPRPDDHPCPACDVPFTSIFYVGFPVRPPQYLLIDDLADWCAFWPAQCGTTAIDFSTHAALVALGSGANLCYEIHVTCVRSGPSPPDLVSTVVESTGNYCECPQEAASLMHVVRVAKPVGSGTFTVRQEELCP